VADDDTRPEGKERKWPKMPDHADGIAGARKYINDAVRLPDGWRVASCVRWGTEGTDAMLLVFDGPDDEVLNVRFDSQAHAGKPSTLRHGMASMTSGKARMHHPSQGQAADFYTMCCALARALETTSTADMTREELRAFLDTAYKLPGSHGLTKAETLRSGLTAIRARAEWRRKDAQRYLTTADDVLENRDRPMVLVDAVTGERWIRAGELATWFRHVGTGHAGGLSQRTLDGLLTEVDVTRHILQTTDNAKPHLRFTLYRVPPVDTEGAP